MKRTIMATLCALGLLAGLAGCGAPTEEQAATKSVSLVFQAENWSYVETEFPTLADEIPVPEAYNGYTYEEACEVLERQRPLSQYDYGLTWGYPQIVSSNGQYTVYGSNKDDLESFFYNMMILDLNTMEERVLFCTESDTTYPHPIWWIDDSRFVYEIDMRYYVCNIETPEDRIELPLEGEMPAIPAYDGGTLACVRNAGNFYDEPLVVATIAEDDTLELIAEIPKYPGWFIAEASLSEPLNLAALLCYCLPNTNTRYLSVHDYISGETLELPAPTAMEEKNGVPCFVFWRDTSLLVAFIVDDESQIWQYTFS